MNKEEFVRVFLPLSDKLYRFAKKYLVSEDEARDAVQEVFLKLWNNRKSVGYDKPEAFAMTMTKNYCLDRLKSKQASNLTLVHSNFSGGSGVEKQVEARDSLQHVFKAMETLPRQQQTVLHLREVEQYKIDEIAKIMDISPGAVRTNLSRARKALREKLSRQQAVAGDALS